ncbi:MAG: phosphatidylglycerophosphatase A [Phycisphaerales bacterium]|nr:phosphatidylglycerophosphatase A [Phycisphaerales bacterium]
MTDVPHHVQSPDPTQRVPDPLIPIPAATPQVSLEIAPGPAAVPLADLPRWLITSFGLGLLRPASGTWGSLPPVFLAAAMLWLGLGPAHGAAWTANAAPNLGPAGSFWIYHGALLLVLVAFSAVCLAYGKNAEVTFGRKDPGQAVADETAAMSMPLMFLPAAAVATPLAASATLAGAFIAFRIFDILKLPPARGLQRLGGGLGILVDDLIASLQAVLVVQLITRLATM